MCWIIDQPKQIDFSIFAQNSFIFGNNLWHKFANLAGVRPENGLTQRVVGFQPKIQSRFGRQRQP